MSASRNSILRLINASQHSACPCHGCSSAGHHGSHHAVNQLRKLATPVNRVEKEYAFEVGSPWPISVMLISPRLLHLICDSEME